MKKSIILLVISLMLSGLVLAKHRDILYTTDGSEFTGELKQIHDNSVVFVTSDGEREFPMDSVKSVDLGTWRPGDDWQNRIDVDDPVLLDAMEVADATIMEYPTAGYVALYEKCEITIDEDYSANIVERYIFYIANERGKNVANWSQSYYEDCMSVEVDFARAIGLSKVSTVADNAIEDGSTVAWLPDYQRLRQKKFALTGASLGSIIDYQVTKKIDKITDFVGFNHRWSWYDTEPIRESHFVVKYAKDLEDVVIFHEFEAPKYDKVKDGKYRGRSYTMENIDPYVEESMLPNLNKVFPNVYVSVPMDMARLSGVYAAKIEELQDDMDAVQAVLEDRFSGEPTLEQIYNYVSENYLNNNMNMRSYYPYPKPLSTLMNKSKIAEHEIVFVLYSFLQAAGFSPQLVMVGPGIDTDIPPEMFNINNFYTLKVKIQDGNTTRYMEPNEYLRYDHQVLHAHYILPISTEGADLVKLDRLPGDYRYVVPKYDCKLMADGSLEATYTEEYNGPVGGDSYRYHKNDKPRELDNFFDSKAKSIDEMANLVDYKLTGYKDLTEKVEISYSVEIPGYATRAGDEILAFKLPTVGFRATDVGASERTLPFSRAGNFYGEKQINISIPEGYEIDYLPENIDISVDYESMNAGIEKNGRMLEYKQVSKGENEPIISPEKYSDYKNFVEKKAKFGESWILIKRK